MKRFFKLAVAVLVALLGVGIAGVGYLAFRTPPVDPLPLPKSLISIDSAAGQALLAESQFVADYERLSENFVSQARTAVCGVASSVVVLNALRSPEPRLTQATIFTEPAREARGALLVTLTGMTLAQLGDLLRAHDLETQLTYASDTDVEAFRSIAMENLRSDDDFLLVNYQRAELGQGEIGHISPVAAYHACDRLLILDVATYKYPPVWVSTEAMWSAMNTIDSSADRSRGFIVAREGSC